METRSLTKSEIKKEVQSEPSQWIRNAFIARKQKNKTYSLRAFARDLGMSQSLLSLVLNGQRPLTLKQAHKIATLLMLSPSEEKKFIECVLASLPENARISQKIRIAKQKQDSAFIVKSFDTEKFHLISNWYHLAILNLTVTRGFKSDSRWIANRLAISKPEVDAALERLLLLGLLEKTNGVYKKVSLNSEWMPTESKAAIRTFHHQMMEKAQNELTKTDAETYSKRSITGTSLAIDTNKIDEAKEFIHEFEKEFARRFSTTQSDEVYQMNLQLFPLTQKTEK
jgi:uncharacterized protein (TIGR02147 family)